jgi:hypothetical protein
MQNSSLLESGSSCMPKSTLSTGGTPSSIRNPPGSGSRQTKRRNKARAFKSLAQQTVPILQSPLEVHNQHCPTAAPTTEIITIPPA